MNMQARGYGRRGRKVRDHRWLVALVAIVLVAGIALQVIMLTQAATRKHTASLLEQEISQIQANVSNLERSIDDYHNLSDIEDRAYALGMQQPETSQIRVVHVARTGQSSEVQTAYNSTSAE